MSAAPQQFDNVSVVAKANVFFDGRVVSHAVLFPDGSKKTLGLVYPGTVSFTTGTGELMEIIAGSCKHRVAGETEWTTCTAGSSFRVPANTTFEMIVEQGIAEYICSFE